MRTVRGHPCELKPRGKKSGAPGEIRSATMPLGPNSVFIRKLESVHPLGDGDRVAIAALPFQITGLRADQDIVRQGDRTTRSCILLEGMACWSKVTGEGRRQILSFHIPGDLPDLQSIH